jgi:hypothetical protein
MIFRSLPLLTVLTASLIVCAQAADTVKSEEHEFRVVKVVEDFRRATRLDERGFERVFASGGGPPAVIGRDARGRLVVPAITLFALVPGIRAQVPDGRARLLEYLLENFDEIVYV